jgi:hypothetical protein
MDRVPVVGPVVRVVRRRGVGSRWSRVRRRLERAERYLADSILVPSGFVCPGAAESLQQSGVGWGVEVEFFHPFDVLGCECVEDIVSVGGDGGGEDRPQFLDLCRRWSGHGDLDFEHQVRGDANDGGCGEQRRSRAE